MSQNSIVLPTTGTVSGLQMTQGVNNALDTLNTLASGSTAPGSAEAGQLWHDTANSLLKIRSLDNTSWIAFMTLNEGAYQALPFFNSQMTGDANRILNAGMDIDQVNEGGSYSIPVNNTVTYALDQWWGECISTSGTPASGVTVQRVSDAPAGFTHSLKVTVATGASAVNAGDYLAVVQPVEANNLSDLGYGTANAAPVSLSFWVKSSVAGTFAVALGNVSPRQIISGFTVTSAGAWQKVTIANIPGDQAGTWGAGNATGLLVTFTIAAGTNYQSATLGAWVGGYLLASSAPSNGVLTTAGATFQITGLMLNAGSFALPFEKRPVQAELQLCERYYQKSFAQGTAVAQNAGFLGNMSVQTAVAGAFGVNVAFRSAMRASPTVTTYNPAAANANWHDYSSNADRTVTLGNISDKVFFIFGASGVALTINNINYSASARM